MNDPKINCDVLRDAAIGHSPGGTVTVPRVKYRALLTAASIIRWSPWFNWRDPAKDNYAPYIRFKPDEVLVEDVYGMPIHKIKPPVGFRLTGEFRAAIDGELALGGVTCIPGGGNDILRPGLCCGTQPNHVGDQHQTGFPVLIIEASADIRAAHRIVEQVELDEGEQHCPSIQEVAQIIREEYALGAREISQ